MAQAYPEPVGMKTLRAPVRATKSARRAFPNRAAGDRQRGPVGGVAERSIAPVLKTGVCESVPWVRLPPPPPLALAKAFSRSGCGRIFPLFARVMRVGLSTGRGTRRAEVGLSGPIFSGPHDCADLVNCL